MAVYTRLGPEEIAEFLGAFRLPAPSEIAGVAAGSINTNYSVVSGGSRYFLRLNEVASEADLRYEAALLAHLEARGMPAPRLLVTRSGEPFAPLRAKRGSLFRFAAGEERTAGTASAVDLRRVGTALARMHAALVDFSVRRPHAFEYEIVRGWIAEIVALRDPALAETTPLLEEELAWLAGARDGTLPRGVIHGDLFPDNVKFDAGGEVSLLFDFEMASDGVLAYDVAVCVLSWCYEGGFDWVRARAFCEGYGEGRALSAAERAGIYAELRLGALRFTVTRIRDFHLRPPPEGERVHKDFRDFLRRLLALRELGADAVQGLLFGP